MAVAAAAFTVGCASPMTLQAARTLPKDDLLLFGAIGPLETKATSDATPARAEWTVNAEAGFRMGVRDGVDFGIKGGTGGFVHSDVKLRVVESKWFDLSFDPGVAGHYSLSFGGIDVRSALIAGVNFRGAPYQPGSSGITFSATPIARLFVADGRDGAGAWLQGSGSFGLWAQIDEQSCVIFEISRVVTFIPRRLLFANHEQLTQFAVALQYRPYAKQD